MQVLFHYAWQPWAVRRWTREARRNSSTSRDPDFCCGWMWRAKSLTIEIYIYIYVAEYSPSFETQEVLNGDCVYVWPYACLCIFLRELSHSIEENQLDSSQNPACVRQIKRSSPVSVFIPREALTCFPALSAMLHINRSFLQHAYYIKKIKRAEPALKSHFLSAETAYKEHALQKQSPLQMPVKSVWLWEVCWAGHESSISAAALPAISFSETPFQPSSCESGSLRSLLQHVVFPVSSR